VTDLAVVNGNSSDCPVGYESALNYSWPGSSVGCYCRPSANLSFVLEGYCSPGLIQSGCLNLRSQPAFTVHNWANYSRLCLRRSPVSFHNEQRYDGTNKICGSSQSLVVVPVGEPCPLVNVSFTPFQLEDHFLTVPDPDQVLPTLYASFNSTSPYSFYAYPVAKLGAQEFEFCQMEQDLGISPSHSDYVLLNVQRGCASEGNWSLLDSQSEIVFFENNPELQALAAVPGFPPPGNWQYRLGFQSLAGWSYKCRHNLNGKYAIPTAAQQLSFSYRGQYQNFLVGVAICLVVLLLEVGLLALRRVINSAVYPVGYRQKHLPRHFLQAILRYVLDLGAKLTLLALGLTNIFILYANYNWFKGAINAQCPDGNLGTLYTILNPFLALYTALLNYALAVIVLCLAMLLVDLVHFFYIWRNELTHYLLDSRDKQLVKKDDTEEYRFLEQKDVLDIQEVKDLDLPRDDHDEFRITMAHNIFAREESLEPLPAGRLKRKKKKKTSPLRRKEEELGLESPNIMEGDGFNPYRLEEGM
jgi:hypothetical protein